MNAIMEPKTESKLGLFLNYGLLLLLEILICTIHSPNDGVADGIANMFGPIKLKSG